MHDQRRRPAADRGALVCACNSLASTRNACSKRANIRRPRGSVNHTKRAGWCGCRPAPVNPGSASAGRHTHRCGGRAGTARSGAHVRCAPCRLRPSGFRAVADRPRRGIRPAGPSTWLDPQNWMPEVPIGDGSWPTRLQLSTGRPLATAWPRWLRIQALRWRSFSACSSSGIPADRSRVEQQFGAGQRHQPRAFRVPLVPAHQQRRGGRPKCRSVRSRGRPG